MRHLLCERVLSVHSRDLTKTKTFFAFPKKGKEKEHTDSNDNNKLKIWFHYSFYVKPQCAHDKYHNSILRWRMSLPHPFSCVNEDVSILISSFYQFIKLYLNRVFLRFWRSILENVVGIIYTSAKHITWKEILISLRWCTEWSSVLLAQVSC